MPARHQGNHKCPYSQNLFLKRYNGHKLCQSPPLIDNMMTQHRRPSVTSFMPQESAAQPTAESVLTTIVPSGMGRRQISSPFAIAPNPDQNAWLIQLEVSGSPEYNLSLTIRNEIILGRGEGENIIDLTSLDAANLGVSRRHLLLRPTLTNLFIIDLGSTNGSLRNGLPIGLNTPYPVVNGDIITLGRLSLTLTVVKRPSVQTGFLRHQSDLADAQAQIAKAITSQLKLEDVLSQVVSAALWLASAGEASIWLVDEETGEWVLEAQQGMERPPTEAMHLTVHEQTPIGKVIRTGKPVRVRRNTGEESLKMATGYMVEALLYVPITLGGVTFGVLAAAHRDPGKQFRHEDEEILSVIADYAAIAIQNARLYYVTDQALERRIHELSALNEVTRTVSASLDLNRVYAVLVEQVNKHWPVAALRLYLLDEEKGELYPFAAAADLLHIQVKQGIIGHVAAQGELIITNEPATHPLYDVAVDSLNGESSQNIACIPLRVQEKIVGVLALYNKKEGIFTEEDTIRLEGLANPVATAVENARLFRVVEQQRSAIQAIAQVFYQPLMILDDKGQTLIKNAAAELIMQNHLGQLFEGLRTVVGRTSEITVGDKAYLATMQHLPEVGTIVVMQDITYVKQLEAARSEFIHVLSHDLKSPLMSIMGWTEVLRHTVKMDENGPRYIHEIEEATNRMSDMIRQLLRTVSQQDAVQMLRQPCQLETILAHAFQDVQGVAHHKNITLHLITLGEPCSILGDENRLYHLFLNLVDNALKYSPPDTKVQVELDYQASDLVIRVQDEGPGIPPMELGRVFEKYYRGKNQMSRTSGIGLGLAGARAIAEAHGGIIAAANRPEGGAEFAVTLPGSLRVHEILP